MTNVAASKGYWVEFPTTYRAEEIATVMQWISAGESGVVIGFAGTGKSNLAGFLGSRPEAITPHISGNPDQYTIVRLDLNSLPALTVPFFYRGLVQTLLDASPKLGSEVEQAMQTVTQGQINWNDTFEVMTVLQKLHHFVVRQAGKRVVWLLDRFDEPCRRLDAQVLSTLRSLRDQFKGELCYVLFTRHPVAYLRDPDEISEFYDIVAANTCWVGPMNERDAGWIANQMADRLEMTFTETDVAQLIEVSGGLPAFMKLGCLALAEGTVSRDETATVWVEAFLGRPEFRRYCQEIWDDLTSDEQNVIAALSGGANENQVDWETLTHLEQAGLLVRQGPDGQAVTFSPIFQAFVAQQTKDFAGTLELHPKTRSVIRGGVPLNVELSSNEDRLLSYFLEHPGEICLKDSLMRTVWPEEELVKGVRDDRLAQLIKRLRDKIEPDPGHPVYIQTLHGRGYRFVQPDE